MLFAAVVVAVAVVDVVAVGLDSVDKGKALHPIQSASLSPALIVDYLTVESRLEKPVRGPHNSLCLTVNKL